VPLGTQYKRIVIKKILHFVPTGLRSRVCYSFYQHLVPNGTKNVNLANADFDCVDFQFNSTRDLHYEQKYKKTLNITNYKSLIFMMKRARLKNHKNMIIFCASSI